MALLLGVQQILIETASDMETAEAAFYGFKSFDSFPFMLSLVF